MTIDILLTVYDAEPFLGEQLRSLQAQTHEDWRLWVRDDGSTDASVRILSAEAERDPRIRVLRSDGARLGAMGGFAWLLERTEESDAPYAMFCDQDDIWLPHKIEATLAAMHAAEAVDRDLPVLVHTDLSVVDRDLRIIDPSYWHYQALRPEKASLRRLLIQNSVTGCTVMMNRALRELASPVPREAFMHDWWVALVACCFGRIVHVAEPTVLYRQHARNQTGARKQESHPATLLRKAVSTRRGVLHGVRDGVRRTARQAGALLDAHRNRLSPEDRRLLRRYAEIPECSPLLRRLRLLELRTLPPMVDRSIGLLLRV